MWFLIHAHTITQSCIKRAIFERVVSEKGGPWAGKIHERGAVRGIEPGGGLDREEAGGEKNNAPPRAIEQGGAGNSGRGPLLIGPWRPRNQHHIVLLISLWGYEVPPVSGVTISLLILPQQADFQFVNSFRNSSS